MKYHVGCGGDIRKGYTNIDGYNSQADVVADAREFKYEKCDEIMSRHFFEHFGLVDSYYLLIIWTLALKIGGKLMITVPDVVKIAGSYSCTPEVEARKMRLIYGSNEGEWAYHKNGWTGPLLTQVVSTLGFGEPEVVYGGGMVEEFPNYELTYSAQKVVTLDQDMLMRKSIDLIGMYFVPEEHLLHRKLGRELEMKFND